MNPEQETNALAMLIQGENQTDIAKSVGVSQGTVSNFKNRDNIKVIIEHCQETLICAGAEKAVENHINTIELAGVLLAYLKCPDNTDNQLLYDSLYSKMEKVGISAKDILVLSDKKENRIGQAAGFMVSHSQSPVTVNILNQKNSIIHDPKVMAAMQRYMTDNDVGIDLSLSLPDNTDDVFNIEADDKAAT